MKLKPVDELVSDWHDKLTVISRNITELTENESAKRVKNRMRGLAQPTYTGLTLQKAQEAFKAIDQLLSDFMLLDSVATEAASLHRRSSIFHNTEEEVRDLLEGPSVRLPATHVPLTQRGLLDSAVQADSARPVELLDAMLEAFDRSNALLNDIVQAELDIESRFRGAQAELATLQAWAAKLGMPDQVDTGNLVVESQADPLEAVANLEKLANEIDGWRQTLQAAELESAQAREALERARRALSKLKELAQRSRRAIEESNISLAGHHTYLESTSQEALAAHEAWFASLEQSIVTRRWKAAKIGIERFEASVRACMDAELKAYTQNRAGLDELDELKGRFKALKAKAKAYSERGALIGPALPGIQANIEHVLGQHQIDLQRLRQLVSAYDTSLLANPNF